MTVVAASQRVFMTMVVASRRVFTCFCRRSISSCYSTVAFPTPSVVSSRRVVVTGLGMVTPLGCGADKTWKNLIDGKCGIRKLGLEDLKMNGFDKETQLSTFHQLTSKVAAIVPSGTNPGEFNEQIWLNSKAYQMNDPAITINYFRARELNFFTILTEMDCFLYHQFNFFIWKDLEVIELDVIV